MTLLLSFLELRSVSSVILDELMTSEIEIYERGMHWRPRMMMGRV